MTTLTINYTDGDTATSYPMTADEAAAMAEDWMVDNYHNYDNDAIRSIFVVTDGIVVDVKLAGHYALMLDPA